MKKGKYATLEQINFIQNDLDKIKMQLWELKNPPKFKESDIVVTVDYEQNISTFEYRILAFKGIKQTKIFNDVHSFCNVYCAIEMQGKSTNCIELYDGLNYILKLKK